MLVQTYVQININVRNMQDDSDSWALSIWTVAHLYIPEYVDVVCIPLYLNWWDWNDHPLCNSKLLLGIDYCGMFEIWLLT